MKPTRNRVMCPECGRSKMLFDSESKAKNFIKWNGDDIDTHGGELRPYYCPACGGYHISSKAHKVSYDHSTERLINAYKKDVETSRIRTKCETKGEAIDRYASELLGRFKNEIPKTMSYTKEWLRELLDAWLRGNCISLDNGTLSVLRFKAYKDMLT